MERPPSPRESEPKSFPTNEEIYVVFEKIRGGRKFEFARPVSDTKGELTMLTMIVANSDGTLEEFQYQRIPEIEGLRIPPAIMVIDIQKDETSSIPATLAEYRHGEWEIHEGVIRAPNL